MAYSINRKFQLSSKIKRNAPDITLFSNKKVKGDRDGIWTSFKLIKENDVELEGVTTCIYCSNIFTYRNPLLLGKSYGTSTLKNHLERCPLKPANVVAAGRNQPKIAGHVLDVLTNLERLKLKRPMTKFVCLGNHSMLSVENRGLYQLCQTIADIAAKRGRSFDVSKELFKRQTIVEDIEVAAEEYITALKKLLVEPVSHGAVALTTDLYTDDYCKRAYIDVHAFWIDPDLTFHHCLLTVRHFGTDSHTGDNILLKLNEILDEYDLKEEDLLITTDMGSNMISALRDQYGRINCANHRLHTCFDDAWKMTMKGDGFDDDAEEAVTLGLYRYEIACAELCAYVKMATAVQEQLPTSLKHGGNTRPWTSVNRRAESINDSYDTLRVVLRTERLHLLIAIDQELNKALLKVTGLIAMMFKRLETATLPTLHLVLPTYYHIVKKCAPLESDLPVVAALKKNLIKSLDAKYWSAMNTKLHWIATFLDPTFRDFDFMVDNPPGYKRRVIAEVDVFIRDKMAVFEENLGDESENETQEAEADEEEAANPDDDSFADMRRPLQAAERVVLMTTVDDELHRYKSGLFRIPQPLGADASEAEKNDPLRFRIANVPEFRLMTGVVRQVLSAPGSSATSERDFSSLGLTITDKRSRLKPQRIEAIEMVKAGDAFGLL